jgi:[ribosomal protein S5]-alanine N-acetyltransferase
MHILETDNLRLSKFTSSDAEFIVRLLNTPTWLQYIGDRGVKSLENARDYLANGPLHSYKKYGYGLSKVTLKHNGVAIGMCGLLHRDYLEFPDIGFAFLPEFCGKGYGYEAASATISYFTSKYSLPAIYAITLPDNSASIGLLKKLQFTEDSLIQKDGEELVLYQRVSNASAPGSVV